MAHCEMCGASADSLTTVKISQAELDVCDDCEDMGTPVDDGPTVSNAETKYSTGSSSEDSTQSETNTDSPVKTSPSDSPMESVELRPDYGEALREARESEGLTVAELADQLNKKESHLREIERANRQPTEELQDELEDFLDVELSMESDFTDFEDGSSGSGQTLGDVADFDV